MPEEIITDGNLHRCPTEHRPRKQNGAYIAHLDKPVTLWWCNWETGEHDTWCAEDKQSFTPDELSAWQERQKAIRQQREAECSRRHAEAALLAKKEWDSAKSANPDHPYLKKKGIVPFTDLRQRDDGVLFVPVLNDSGAIQSLQRIYPDGSKRFLVGGKIQGGYFVIQGDGHKPIAICEGYATGASIHQATGCTVYVAFSANNLQSVALAARKRFPESAIVICADNDETGRKKGEEAAKAVNGRFAVSTFTTGNGTDFNGLHQTENIEAVRSQLEAVLVKPQALWQWTWTNFCPWKYPTGGIFYRRSFRFRG